MNAENIHVAATIVAYACALLVVGHGMRAEPEVFITGIIAGIISLAFWDKR